MPGLTLIDIVAVVWFFTCAFGYGYATRYGPLANAGIVAAMNQQRLRWMENMAQRDNRIVDVQVLATLSRGNAFFASTAVIVTGALAALFGAVDQMQAIASRFPYLHQTTIFMWHLKMLFMMGIFIFAFFKFAWAFRLSHYTAVVIGATPIATSRNKRQCLDHAKRAATLAGLVGIHGNGGLRAYYFGIAALGWFIHPALFMVAILWVIGVLYRREYKSRALAIIAERAASAGGA